MRTMHNCLCAPACKYAHNAQLSHHSHRAQMTKGQHQRIGTLQAQSSRIGTLIIRCSLPGPCFNVV
eukprot:5328238-Pleurochrysis_carterae.AAC.1